MKTVAFTVFGKPQPKQRPRYSGKTQTMYTPSKTHKYETYVRQTYLASGSGMVSENGQVYATIKCYLPIPGSATKKRREAMMAGKIRPTNRRSGDADNIAKSILDALNGYAYTDDSQIVSLVVDKWYVTEPDGEPLVDVVLSGTDAPF